MQWNEVKNHSSLTELHSNFSRKEDFEGFGSLSDTGADLSNYREQLTRTRNSRTLTLRRINHRPTITKLLKNNMTPQPANDFIDSTNFPFLDPSNVISTINSGNLQDIAQMCSSIVACAQNTPRLLSTLLKSADLAEALTNEMNNSESIDYTAMIMLTITILFPLAEQTHDIYIDSGINMNFSDYLANPNPQFVLSTIALIEAISEYSAYGRDSILCTGLLFDLVDLALKTTDQQIMEACCQAILKVFANPALIDPSQLLDCFESVARLLSIQSSHAIQSVIDIFVEMTNKMPSIVFRLFKMDLSSQIVQLLSEPMLIGAVLHLIGNMSVAQPSQINTMLGNGLFNYLIQLVGSEYTADVYWVFSNLIESVPQSMIPLFDDSFVYKSVEIANESNFETKKEATYFISTLIIFAELSQISVFIHPDIVDLLIEMLGCGVGLIVLRSMDSLYKFVQFYRNGSVTKEFITAIIESDARDRLENLIEQKLPYIEERAKYLLNQLDMLEEAAGVA